MRLFVSRFLLISCLFARPGTAVEKLNKPSVVPGHQEGDTGAPAVKKPALRRGKKTADGYTSGLASWYGKILHGHRTASGERFDMYQYTAAHRTLPFGTMVRVTNLHNGRSVLVRINDRGILSTGRVIDLSYAAAVAVDMKTAGVTKVRLEVIDPVTTASRGSLDPAPETQESYTAARTGGSY